MSDHLTETQFHELCDSAPGEPAAETLRVHLGVCPSCRDRMTRFEALLAAAAAAPSEMPPPDDLWPSIRSRLESGKVAVIAQGPPPFASRPWWAGAGPALGAAAVLVLVTATITVVLVTPQPTVEAPSASGGTMVIPANAPVNVTRLVSDYEGLINRLARDFAGLRHQLPAEAVATVEENLRVIDEALAEIQEVLAQEPENRALLELLATVYRQKVSILEHASESIS